MVRTDTTTIGCDHEREGIHLSSIYISEISMAVSEGIYFFRGKNVSGVGWDATLMLVKNWVKIKTDL